MTKNDKLVHNYIDNINLSEIAWIKLSPDELREFFKENYLDEDEMQYIRDESNTSPLDVPLGLHYLSFNHIGDDYSFLLGVANNNIGKKTIISAMIYLENYYLFTDQKIPMTYISSVEVNSYFWNNGIYKRLCEKIIEYINPNQHLMVSRESEMGKSCRVTEILEKTLIKNGFEKRVFVNCFLNYNDLNLHDLICADQMVLEKNRNM